MEPLMYMHRVQADVWAVHKALDIPIGDWNAPEMTRQELRAELIREEARETVDAIEAGDFAAALDGLCDLLCVTYGAAVEWGINLEDFWPEVHRTNMAKMGGPVRDDGKRLKPQGWTPPDIAGILAKKMKQVEA
jgi:predicted HAD superfamily Cof-like phosphohydrolase